VTAASASSSLRVTQQADGDVEVVRDAVLDEAIDACRGEAAHVLDVFLLATPRRADHGRTGTRKTTRYRT
jgi:hypothetical protein